MEKMSTKDLISYTDIKLGTNGFNLCTPKNDAPNIKVFGMLKLCDVKNLKRNSEQKLRTQLAINHKQ